jgi:hypothetical protein
MNTIVKYAKSLVGAPYLQWKSGNTTDKPEPFYVNQPKSITYVKKHGINCVGLINLLMHKVGNTIPGKGKYIGSTYPWFKSLKEKGVLQEFDLNTRYPVGTLFIRNYKNISDQGHVCMLIENKKNHPLYDLVIEATYGPHKKLSEGKVLIQIMGSSHFTMSDGLYKYAIHPSDWILT